MTIAKMQSQNCSFLCLKTKIVNRQSAPNIELRINRIILLVALNSLKGVFAFVPTKKASFIVKKVQAEAISNQSVCTRCIIFMALKVKSKIKLIP